MSCIIIYMKKLFFILTIVFFSNLSEAYSQCSDIFFSPEIDIKYSYGKLKYDYSKDKEEITKLANNTGILEKGIFALGLSSIDINFDIKTENVTDFIDKNSFCVYPQKIIISIYFKNPTIYISNQLKKESCEYNLVKRHEQTHIQINKAALDYYLPLFYRGAEKIANNISPINVSALSDINKASDQIAEQFNQKFYIIFNYVKQQILEEQQKLDNQNNYQYENKLCQ